MPSSCYTAWRPRTRVLEMEALAKAYQTYNLPVSAQTMEEVRWLHENYYGRRDKASGSVKCRIPRFAMVCDHIANIQRLQLRKVTFQRHLEKTQFVGELFAQDFDVSPPYLLQSNMQLLCSLPAGNLRKREDLSADLPDEAAARHDLQLDEGSPAFFAEVGSDGRSIGSSTRTYGRFDWPDLRSLNASDWKGTCPVISAGDVVQIVSEPWAKLAKKHYEVLDFRCAVIWMRARRQVLHAILWGCWYGTLFTSRCVKKV